MRRELPNGPDKPFRKYLDSTVKFLGCHHHRCPVRPVTRRPTFTTPALDQTRPEEMWQLLRGFSRQTAPLNGTQSHRGRLGERETLQFVLSLNTKGHERQCGRNANGTSMWHHISIVAALCNSRFPPHGMDVVLHFVSFSTLQVTAPGKKKQTKQTKTTTQV